MRSIEILFFAANPFSTSRLALDREAREIEEKIRGAKFRDQIKFKTHWATRPDDLIQAFNEHQPTVVHFSGHGSQSGEILLDHGDGESAPVQGAALERLFRVFSGTTRLVVLNACYSEPQARVIAEIVGCAIGMTRAIGDSTAITFAGALPRGIAFNASLKNAFEQGLLALDLRNMSTDIPSLLHRGDVVPE